MLFLASVSWGATAQHDYAAHGAQASNQKMEPMFKDKALGSSYTHYIHLKNALVTSDFQKAKSASESLVIALHKVKGSDKVHTEAAKVAQAGSLGSQRKAFTALSNGMTTLVKGADISMGELYLGYCPWPMATPEAIVYPTKRRSATLTSVTRY